MKQCFASDVLKLIGDSDTHLKKLQSQPSMCGMSFHKVECVHQTTVCRRCETLGKEAPDGGEKRLDSWREARLSKALEATWGVLVDSMSL